MKFIANTLVSSSQLVQSIANYCVHYDIKRNSYLNKESSVLCTFLDASDAFDRLNYCKLFRLLNKRDLPACIIRVLINMYTGHLIRISWAGVLSDYINVLNGVKQGGVINPILFCICIDDWLISLSQLGVLSIHVFVRVMILYVVLLCTALFMANSIRLLVEILGFVVVISVGSWKIFY